MAVPDPAAICHGDRMSREEFLDRWDREPWLKKAELIEGSVYLPLRPSESHAVCEGLTCFWLGYYAGLAPGCRHLSNATWLMTRHSVPQPDQSLCQIGPGARSRVENGLRSGVPELAVEVCDSRRSYDLGVKLRMYGTAGVPEYLALIIEQRRIEWRVLEGGQYRMLKRHRDGMLRSRIFPGLWLDIEAFWREDRGGLRAAVDRGVPSR